MRRAIVWVSGFCLLGAVQGLSAQTVETAAALTSDAMVVYRFCADPSRTATTPVAATAAEVAERCSKPYPKRVVDWVTSPTSTVPSRGVLDSAIAVIRGQVLAAQADTGGNKILLGDGRLQGVDASSGGVSRFAWALTDVIIARARQELTAAALQDFRSKLSDSKLKPLFESSLAALHAIDDADVSLVVPMLRTAFREDFRRLPVSLGDPAIVWHSGASPDALAVTSFAAKLLLLNRRGPITYHEALNALPANTDRLQPALKTGVEVLRIALNEQVACVARRDAPADACLERLIGDPTSGRVYERYLVDRWSEIRRLDETRVMEYLRAFASFSRSLQAAIAESELAERDSAALRLGIPRAVLTLVRDVVSKDDAVTLRRITAADGIVDALSREDYEELAVRALVLVESEKLLDDSATKVLRKTLAFGAALSSASTTEEVAATIEAFADPVGSFRQRRTPGMRSVAVVAYPGFSTGYEVASGPGARSGAMHLGLSVPVGVEWRIGGKRGGFGVFVGALDLGALASYRVNATSNGDTTVAADPEVTWDNILAPSVMFTGTLCPEFPTMFGLGYQYAPRLRELTTGGQRVSAHRVSFFVAVDVTLLTIARGWAK